jgi:hypothetical protein
MSTIAQRGVMAVASAHGSSLRSLLANRELNPLLGGVRQARGWRGPGEGGGLGRREGKGHEAHPRKGGGCEAGKRGARMARGLAIGG